ncbi:hypothetical protein NSK_003241 [Nannochloropsis salina CCMP1776]|uniref:holo-[acyl-carrier-protein] synthase n=1 Tax=Nannochloropsis salina CCMP1776 TaxID=1027361 RepID=A0A4D9D5U4_9STRA|nr:hypothetical protein NSK_003241 [Nannochloropsis salina CCMP1776]|eukprot:TFJ85737.1 hypothetical protein NSK_003241 [Nannochloropsis salina CCMP1776]
MKRLCQWSAIKLSKSTPKNLMEENLHATMHTEPSLAASDPALPPLPPGLQGRALAAVHEGVLRLGMRIVAEQLSPDQWNLLIQLLSESEGGKVQRYYHDKDRRLALGSILLQRAATSWVLGKRFSDINIERTRTYNKPYVNAKDSRLPQWNYNVSHHGEWVVLASEPFHAVGTDLVDVGDRPFEAMTALEYLEHFKRHLTPAEWQGLRSVGRDGEASQYRAFYRVWAMKEAYVKAIGVGLSFPVRRLECSVVDVGADLTGMEADGVEEELMMDGYIMTDWRLRLVSLPPSYLWCTAVGPKPTAHHLPSPDNVRHCAPCSACLYAPPSPSKGICGTSTAIATATPASSAPHDILRKKVCVLTIRDCLPLGVQAQWDALSLVGPIANRSSNTG